MCWSPKIKTPAVTATVAAPAANEPIAAPKGVEFGDEDQTSASLKSKGIKSLTIKKDEDAAPAVQSTNFGASSFGSSAVSKALKGKAK